jgi:hypothetical protein
VVIWSNSLLYISFSITFGKEVSRDIGLKLGSIMQIYVSGDTMYGALSFSIHVEISSFPRVFLDFMDLIIFPVS